MITTGSRPKLLIVATLAEAGGAQTFVRSLIEGLRDDYTIDVAAHGPTGALADACAQAGIPFHHVENLVRRPSPGRDVRAVLEIRRLIGRLRPDLVQINSTKAGLVARLALIGTGVPAVFTAHGWAFSGRRGLARLTALFVEKATAPLSAAIVCVSDWDWQLAISRGIAPPQRLRHISNGIAVPEASPERGPWPLRPLLLCVARLAPPKDIRLLLDALAQDDLQRWRLEIIGDGPDRASLQAHRDELRLSRRVEFLGERQDVAEHLARADAFVLPSKWEGLPYSILEAMSAGLPVIASRVGGIPELVVPGVTGLLVNPGDADALSAALRTLLNSGRRAREFGREGHARVKGHFRLDQMVAGYHDLFRSVLAGRVASPGRSVPSRSDARST
jgi:glycosyltransferase involved in cell wall biosynthesis